MEASMGPSPATTMFNRIADAFSLQRDVTTQVGRQVARVIELCAADNIDLVEQGSDVRLTIAHPQAGTLVVFWGDPLPSPFATQDSPGPRVPDTTLSLTGSGEIAQTLQSLHDLFQRNRMHAQAQAFGL
jgi:hypothetical protein